jgi:hypothetical protein
LTAFPLGRCRRLSGRQQIVRREAMLVVLAHATSKALPMQKTLDGRTFEALCPLDKADNDLSWWHTHLYAN